MATVFRRAQMTELADVLTVDLATLMLMTADELTQIWRRQFGKAAPLKLPKSLLARLLAYRLQAERYGDLQGETIRTLDRIADELEAGREAVITPVQNNRLMPGTVLVREHAGAMHRVMVLAEGYAWNGETYPSLSAVAKAITGTNWNGLAFFGLKEKKTAKKRSDLRSGRHEASPHHSLRNLYAGLDRPRS